MVKDKSDITIIRDTREKIGFRWDFKDFNIEDKKLPTGDYTIKGLEDKFIIDRKATTNELSGNINQKRFKKELDRLIKFEDAYIVCECGWSDVLSFPYNSTIPNKYWPKLKTTASSLQKGIMEWMTIYGLNVVFCETPMGAQKFALCLLKRMIEKYGL